MSRTWWFGVAVGILLLTLGVAETVRVLMSGDLSGLAFWFGTLIGGGTCVLVGTALSERRPLPAFAVTTAGCVAGILPTMWTVVVPALLVTLVVLRALQLHGTAPAQPA
ncbi:MAG TPA: hypothetical protein VE503_05595 [Ornithinibacter sp.]|jgi:hypothetical protein|nr:hypothetical protein [Ornithinibacter sp.]